MSGTNDGTVIGELGYEYLNKLFGIYGKPMGCHLNGMLSSVAAAGPKAETDGEAEAELDCRVNQTIGPLGDEGYESDDRRWRESSIDSFSVEEGPRLNFEWVLMAVGCGPVLPVDLSDALSQVGLRHREVPMYEDSEVRLGSCLGKRGRECLSDDDDLVFQPTANRKKRCGGGGRWTPGSELLFQRVLAQSVEENENGMDLDFSIPTFHL